MSQNLEDSSKKVVLVDENEALIVKLFCCTEVGVYSYGHGYCLSLVISTGLYIP